jgi:hypothetical protein
MPRFAAATGQGRQVHGPVSSHDTFRRPRYSLNISDTVSATTELPHRFSNYDTCLF